MEVPGAPSIEIPSTLDRGALSGSDSLDLVEFILELLLMDLNWPDGDEQSDGEKDAPTVGELSL